MKFTTCITNWSRINQLKGCIESLRPHEGLMDISVACFGATPEHRKDGADPLDWKKDEERRLQAKTVANNGGNIPDFTVDARTGRVTWNRYVPLSQRIVRL